MDNDIEFSTKYFLKNLFERTKLKALPKKFEKMLWINLEKFCFFILIIIIIDAKSNHHQKQMLGVVIYKRIGV